jgi:DNA-binding phage protein
MPQQPVSDLLSDATLIQEMEQYVNLAYSIFLDKHHQHGEPPIHQLARESGLARVTVDRLIGHQTKYPRYLTVKKFGEVCGLRLVFTKSGQPRLKLVG